MQKPLLIVLIAILLLLFALPTAAADTHHSLTVGERERFFHLHTPPQSPDEAVPLVIAFHPVTSSANAMRAITGFDAAADEMGFAVAYPQAVSYYWDDGRAAAGMLADDGEIDEQAFVEAMIAEAQQSANIDPERIYLTGIANGGNLAYTLACQMPEQLAGVAVVSSLLWDFQAENCGESGVPVNLLIIHGSADSSYQINGRTFDVGEASTERVVSLYSLERTLNFWSDRMGCEMEHAYDSVALVTYACDNNTSLNYFNVIGGEEAWFRSVDNQLLNTYHVDATEIIANFFMTGSPSVELLSQTPMEPTELGRSFTLYIPNSYTFDEPIPLVMVLHGRPGNGPGMALLTDMNAIAEANHFIAVYPDGLIPPSEPGARGWNYVRDIALFNYNDGSAISQRDDVQFLVDLKHDLAEMMPIDTERSYITGFSNGGFMTQRMACDAAGSFAAFAAVGSTLSWGMPAICEDRPPVPLLMMHGTQDISVPWTGTTTTVSGREIYMTAPIPNTLAFWLEHNGCIDETTREDLPQLGQSPGTSVSVLTYADCQEPLVFVAVENGGHNWPGVLNRIGERIAGSINMDIHAGQFIWDFLKQFTLPEARIEAAEAVATPSAPIVVEDREPSSEEAEQLANAQQVVTTLQGGGFVIYFKHGDINPDYADETCAAQDALTPNGDNQAGLLYDVIQSLSLPIGQVVTDGSCASKQTLARAFTTLPDAVSAYTDSTDLQAALSRVPQDGTNTLIIGDGNLLAEITGNELGPSDTMMVLPNSQTYAVLTVATIYDWIVLGDLVNGAND